MIPPSVTKPGSGIFCPICETVRFIAVIAVYASMLAGAVWLACQVSP